MSTGNSGGIVLYAFFEDDQSADHDPCLDHASCAEDDLRPRIEDLVALAESALGLDRDLATQNYPRHVASDAHGHELLWVECHEGDALIVAVGRTPDGKDARAEWQRLAELAEPLVQWIDSRAASLQGHARIFLASASPHSFDPLRDDAADLLRRRLPARASTHWGELATSPDWETGVLLFERGFAPEVEVFVEGNLMQSLYGLTKGRRQYEDFMEIRDDLRTWLQEAEAEVSKARSSPQRTDDHSLEALQRIATTGETVGRIMTALVQARVALLKARTIVSMTLRPVIRIDRGVVGGMERELLEREEVLAAEVDEIRERSAQLDRVSDQFDARLRARQNGLLVENAKHRLLLQSATRIVEFVLVLYYSLGAWGYIAGEHRLEHVPWWLKLTWAGLVGLGVPLAAHRLAEKGRSLSSSFLAAGVAALALGSAVYVTDRYGAEVKRSISERNEPTRDGKSEVVAPLPEEQGLEKRGRKALGR